MAFNIYNLKNQALNAEKNREISYFTTNNFGGILNDDYTPIKIVDSTITWDVGVELPVKFIGGGCVIECGDKLNYTFSGVENLYALKVVLNTDNATIAHNRLETTDRISYIGFEAFSATSLGLSESYHTLSIVDRPQSNPKQAGYYYYDGVTHSYLKSQSEFVQPGVVYYSDISSQNLTFTINYKGANLNNVYYGNTVWLDDTTFIIPIAIKQNNVVSQVVTVHSKNDIDDLMSMGNYKRLKDYVEQNFVWHEGGQGLVFGSDYAKGDIGELNINGNAISHQTNINGNTITPVRISTLQVDDLGCNQNTTDAKILVDNDGRLSIDPYYKTPVQAGGTYMASNWNPNNPRLSAKQNIGINYGTGAPTATTATKEGDIYFRIVDGSEIETPKKVEPSPKYYSPNVTTYYNTTPATTTTTSSSSTLALWVSNCSTPNGNATVDIKTLSKDGEIASSSSQNSITKSVEKGSSSVVTFKAPDGYVISSVVSTNGGEVYSGNSKEVAISLADLQGSVCLRPVLVKANA